MKIKIVVSNRLVFQETAVGICDALYICGIDSEVESCVAESGSLSYSYQSQSLDEKNNDVLYIILGLHLFRIVPRLFIAVQSEQIGSKWMTDSYFEKLKKAQFVLDFSPRNCAHLRNRGISCHNVRTRVPMEIFYADSWVMKKHFSGRNKDVDVLFYGSKCLRRERLEKKLKRSAKNMRVVFRYNDLFRDEREDLISRSKVVLNVHYWPASSLETHRVEYLCSRGKCIVSELSSDTELDLDYFGSVSLVPYNSIVERTEHFVGDDLSRKTFEIASQKKSFDHQTRNWLA